MSNHENNVSKEVQETADWLNRLKLNNKLAVISMRADSELAFQISYRGVIGNITLDAEPPHVELLVDQEQTRVNTPEMNKMHADAETLRNLREDISPSMSVFEMLASDLALHETLDPDSKMLDDACILIDHEPPLVKIIPLDAIASVMGISSNFNN
jgi:hypothetical protein